MVRYVPPACDRASDWLRITGVEREGGSKGNKDGVEIPLFLITHTAHSWELRRQFERIITTGGFYPATSASKVLSQEKWGKSPQKSP